MGRLGAIFFCLVLLTACASSDAPKYPPESPVATIHVVSHGWHTGIVIRKRDIPAGAWPESADFPDAEYLEVGWGDRDYYREKSPSLWTGSKAVLWPTPSVLQIVAFRGPVSGYFPKSSVVALPVSQEGLLALCAHISASYGRNERGESVPLGISLYGEGRFYAATGRFHLFNNCNVWTARALYSAGIPISPSWSLTAGRVIDAARENVRKLK